MKKGKYNYPEKTIHPEFGWLEPGKIYELPDNWDFEKETLFEKVGDDVEARKPKREPSPLR